MTLLILDLKVPVARRPDGALLPGLFALWPRALAYLMSFFALANLWIAHRSQFHFVRRSDRVSMWVNMLFFMLVSTIPFATAFLAEYPGQKLPTIVYGLVLIATIV